VIADRGGSAWSFLAKTSDSDAALHNLLKRDRMFTDHLRDETLRLNLHAIQTDPTTTEDDLIRRVTDLFEL
jgi:hypothetical protein